MNKNMPNLPPPLQNHLHFCKKFVTFEAERLKIIKYQKEV